MDQPAVHLYSPPAKPPATGALNSSSDPRAQPSKPLDPTKNMVIVANWFASIGPRLDVWLSTAFMRSFDVAPPCCSPSTRPYAPPVTRPALYVSPAEYVS